MAEYTYKDIIIDPTSEEAKNAIGKKCYMYDSPTMLLKMANSDDDARTLESIDESDYPFNDKEFGSEWTCIIVKKEPCYEDQVKQWIEENNLKVGDYVKVTRRANEHEHGWKGLWLDDMDESVEKTLKVKDIDTYVYTIGLENGFYYPYFVLEKTEPLKPEYVPFKSIEEFVERYTEVKEGTEFGTFEDNLLQCGMWIKSKDDDDLSQITVIREHGICIDTMSTIVLWKNLLDDFEFIDGTPCGKLEEESNA